MDLEYEGNKYARTYDAFDILTRCILLHPNLLSIVIRQSGEQTEQTSPRGNTNITHSLSMGNIERGGASKTPVLKPLPQKQQQQQQQASQTPQESSAPSIPAKMQLLNKDSKQTGNESNASSNSNLLTPGNGTSGTNSSLTPILSPMSLDANLGKQQQHQQQTQLNHYSLSELFHILLSCYTMKIVQVCIEYVMFTLSKSYNNAAKYENFSGSDWFGLIQKQCGMKRNSRSSSDTNEKIEDAVLYYVVSRVLPFLRKCCLILNTFGLIESEILENVLWRSIADNAMSEDNFNMVSLRSKEKSQNQNQKPLQMTDSTVVTSLAEMKGSGAVFDYDCDMSEVVKEVDQLCDILKLPLISDCILLFANEEKALQRKKNYKNNNSNKPSSKMEIDDNENENFTVSKNDLIIGTMHSWIVNYLATMSNIVDNEELEYLFHNSVIMPLTDTIKIPKLATLPKEFDPLFQRAYELHCDNKPKKVPEESAICLLCGKFLCINCCRYDPSDGQLKELRGRNEDLKGSLTMHAKECGFGKCVFLWLQRSDIILIYEHAAAIFNSPYLDGFGEEDSGLRRGGLLYLNNVRYNRLTQMVTDQTLHNRVCQLRSRGKHYLRNWF